MRQATTSALDDRLRDGLSRVGSADLLVGIPSFNNAATVGHVARTVAEGLRAHFPDSSPVIVNADGGSKDGTRLITPIREGKADYVTPLYARHKFDGTITNNVAYPVTRALYGLRLRQPIGGEFGFSPELARDFLDGIALGGANVWETDVARFGIDIYMTTTALVTGRRTMQAFLGAKIHDPKDPGADLAPMFTQVVSTLFRLAIANPDSWKSVRGSKPAEVFGSIDPVEPEAVNASVDILRQKYAAGRAEHATAWDRILSAPVPERVDETAWARIVYDFLLAAKRRPDDIQGIVGSLVPLYFARVASFIEDAKDLDTAGSEALIERQAGTFEQLKHEGLVSRW